MEEGRELGRIRNSAKARLGGPFVFPRAAGVENVFCGFYI